MGDFSSKRRSRGEEIFCEEGLELDYEILGFSEEYSKNLSSQASINEANNENKDKKTQVVSIVSELDYEIVEFSEECSKNPSSQVSINEANNDKKTQVVVEGYYTERVAEEEEKRKEGKLMRTKSLTKGDLEELKGCLDLGFGFSYEEIPKLCNTLPALELCYSLSQKFLDDHQKPPEWPPPVGLVANWRISSPGDHPDDVKARLKYWAQAVACTIRLCT